MRIMEKTNNSKYPVFKLLLLLCVFSLFFTCAPEKRLGKRFRPKPCLECHKESLAEFEKKYVHSPKAAGTVRHVTFVTGGLLSGPSRKGRRESSVTSAMLRWPQKRTRWLMCTLS